MRVEKHVIASSHSGKGVNMTDKTLGRRRLITTAATGLVGVAGLLGSEASAAPPPKSKLKQLASGTPSTATVNKVVQKLRLSLDQSTVINATQANKVVAKVKKALFYPAAVLAVAVIVTIILLLFVIPQFEDLFKGFGADLPAFTQMVISMSKFIQTKGIFLAVVAGGAVFAFLYFQKRSRKFREWLDRLTLKAPVIGPIMHKSAVARFARTLSTMFAAGVPLVEAMDSVAGATGNIVYENATLAIRDEVATGTRLQRAMENTDLFPNMVIQMIAVGEESGALDEMSGKVATFYEAEVDNAVDSMSSLLEPLIMAILGVLVGGLVIAMYLPIFKLGAVV